ncbi:MAG: zinc metalloprotease HtpX [bacterium]
MAEVHPKTFWDIEKEKTWRIYILFGFLIMLYFCPVFVIWSLIKIFLDIKQSIYGTGSSFQLFDNDTLLILLIAGLAAGIHWYYSNKQIVGKALRLLRAKSPDKRDKYHYMFQNIVDEIETAAGGFKVERFILPTGAMNAFALADLSGRRVLGITEGLLSRLNREELQAVVAHEMSHIVSNDCLHTTITCSLFNIYSEALVHFNQALNRQEPQGASPMVKSAQQNVMAVGFLSLLAFLLFFITDLLGQLLNMFISREKEYRADASAVKLTRDPVSLASALYKIGIHWRGTGYGGEQIAAIFVLSPRLRTLDEKEGFFATLFSTHPPLLKRLRIILCLAHADLAEVFRHVADNKTIKTEDKVMKPAIRFRVWNKDQWQGPFTILQLQSLDWLQPGTELNLPGHDEVLHADEIPALNYFFHKRDEPMWKMKRLCPDCRKWLIVQSYEGLYLWRCAFCDGLLAEGDKLPRIFVRREKGFTERVRRLAKVISTEARQKHPNFNVVLDISHPKRCPKCGKDMVHKFYSYAFHVEIDECLHCKLIWFDPDELEILQCLIEMEEGERN